LDVGVALIAEIKPTHTWDLWIPDAGSQGISFARGWLEATDVLWVHAAPTLLRVEVSTSEGHRVGFGDRLERAEDTPMTRLRLCEGKVEREDAWPGDEDLGDLVILPGGEVGTLKNWWSPADHREWRWTLELYNHR
jgi:hypothetical protein